MRQLYTALHEEKNSGGAKPAHLSLQALLGDDAAPIEADGPSGVNPLRFHLMVWAFFKGLRVTQQNVVWLRRRLPVVVRRRGCHRRLPQPHRRPEGPAHLQPGAVALLLPLLRPGLHHAAPGAREQAARAHLRARLSPRDIDMSVRILRSPNLCSLPSVVLLALHLI